ncbi:hypothetical protein EV207_14021 [Scopulibacillus darangshiensis]|uniref:Uncharacterized protein n=1 Tax=Scopulibacillus darangshiensis TaxID=442528 RepID=A0A4R2NK13_9BACL|nr:hypothetical protein EV207_14021 [Scopulibacillus darangshiensis]
MVYIIILDIFTLILSGGLGYIAYKLSKKYILGMILTILIGFVIPYSLTTPQLFLGTLFGIIFYVILAKKRSVT